MPDNESSHVPFWSLTKDQQKHEIETAIREFLDRHEPLVDHQKFFLTQALGHVARGLFGIALQDIIDAYREAKEFSPSFKISSAEIEGVTKESLRRALRYSGASPALEYPIFR